jgi:subtilisin family serine protease
MNLIMKKIFVLALLFLNFSLCAQSKYWVFFKNKPHCQDTTTPLVSAQSLENRISLGLPTRQWTDIPVNQSYVDSLLNYVKKIRVYSKWLNGISIETTENEIEKIVKFPFVSSVEKIRGSFISTSKSNNPEYGTAISQMKAEAFAKAGASGKGVTVGVIDAGFFKADKDPYLTHLFEEGRVLGYKDYVSPSKKDFFGVSGDNSTHGTTVLSMIAGLSKSYQKGMAIGAKFYLARTDDDDTEYRIEEDYWIAAMEWMDSLGVRLINTSLGYALGHTLPEEDYQTWQMDGKTTKITKAAQIAAQEKGMILVNSAGNEGQELRWGIISAPADAKDVISVGATNILGEKADYASIGSKELPYVKPNIACFSLNGTSFSAPAITGFVACMLELEPSLKREKVIEILQSSAHLYPFANNYLGYGIPNAEKAVNLLKSKDYNLPIASKKKASGKNKIQISLKNKTTQRVIFFHKENETFVKTQTSGSSIKKGKISLEKPSGIRFTTIVAGEEVFEVIW